MDNVITFKFDSSSPAGSGQSPPSQQQAVNSSLVGQSIDDILAQRFYAEQQRLALANALVERESEMVRAGTATAEMAERVRQRMEAQSLILASPDNSPEGLAAERIERENQKQRVDAAYWMQKWGKPFAPGEFDLEGEEETVYKLPQSAIVKTMAERVQEKLETERDNDQFKKAYNLAKYGSEEAPESMSGVLGKMGMPGAGLIGKGLESVGSMFGISSGAMGGAAAALAPYAAPIAAVVMAMEYAGKKTTEAVNNFGNQLSAVASLDMKAFSLGLIDAAAKQVPFFGDAISAAARQVFSFTDALSATASKLAPFSGQLAVAEAMGEVQQTLGDMRRAQQLGPELAKFVNERTRLEQAGQDVMAAMLEPLIPVITEAMSGLAEILEFFAENKDAIKFIVSTFTQAEQWLMLLKANNMFLRAIKGNTDKEVEDDVFAEMIEDILRPGVDPSMFRPREGQMKPQILQPVTI